MPSVLVIEDDAANRYLLQRLFESEGWTVHLAQDSEEAQRVLSEARPSVITCDSSSGGPDDFGFVRRLQASGLVEGIPVVPVTTRARAEDRAKAMELGCAAFFTKPINTRTFISEVRRVLGIS